MTGYKKDWSLTAIANKAANVVGLSVVRSSRLPQSVEPFFKFFGNAVVYGHWNQEKYINDGFVKNATLYSIVNRITSVSAQASETFKVFKVKDKAKAVKYKAWTGERATKESVFMARQIKEAAYELDTNHPFNALLAKPNDWQGLNEFIQTSIGFKLLTGNRFLFTLATDMGANAFKPQKIYNLPPQYMRILRDESVQGNLWSISGYQLNLGSAVDIPKEMVIHSRYWNPVFDLSGSHLWGLSPLSAAARRLDIARLAEDRSNAMMKNAGGAGVLYNKTATEKPSAKMKRIVNEEVLGLENAETIHLANGDLGFLQFGMKAVDMQIIEQERYTDEKLCNIYKVPPGLFMASANATDNNIAAWNRQLITQAALPALSDFRDDLQTILTRGWGDGWYVDYDPSIFPEMQEDQGKLADILNKSPYLTQNEKRIVRGYDEDMDEPMMRRYLYPMNVVDITTLNPDNMDPELNDVDEQLSRREAAQQENESA